MISNEEEHCAIGRVCPIGDGINEDLVAGMRCPLDAVMQLIDNGVSGAEKLVQSGAIHEGLVQAELRKWGGEVTLVVTSTSEIANRMAAEEMVTLKMKQKDKIAATVGKTNNKSEGMNKAVAACGADGKTATGVIVHTDIDKNGVPTLQLSVYGSSVNVPETKPNQTPSWIYIPGTFKEASGSKPMRFIFDDGANEGHVNSDKIRALIFEALRVMPENGASLECDTESEKHVIKMDLFNRMVYDMIYTMRENQKVGKGTSLVRVMITNMGKRDDKNLFRIRCNGDEEYLSANGVYENLAVSVARKFTTDTNGVDLLVSNKDVHRLVSTAGGTDPDKNVPMAPQRLLDAFDKPENQGRIHEHTVVVDGTPRFRFRAVIDASMKPTGVASELTTNMLTKQANKLASMNTMADIAQYEQDMHDKGCVSGVVVHAGNRVLNPNPGCMELTSGERAVKCNPLFSNGHVELEKEKNRRETAVVRGPSNPLAAVAAARRASDLLENRNLFLCGKCMDTVPAKDNPNLKVPCKEFVDFEKSDPDTCGLGLNGTFGATNEDFAKVNLLPDKNLFVCCGRSSGIDAKKVCMCKNKARTSHSVTFDPEDFPAYNAGQKGQGAYEVVIAPFCRDKVANSKDGKGDHKTDAVPNWTNEDMKKFKIVVSDNKQVLSHSQVAFPVMMVTDVDVLDLAFWARTSDANKERYGELPHLAAEQHYTADQLMGDLRKFQMTTLWKFKPRSIETQLECRAEANARLSEVLRHFAELREENEDKFVENTNDPELKAAHERVKAKATKLQEELDKKQQEKEKRDAKNEATREERQKNKEDCKNGKERYWLHWGRNNQVIPRKRPLEEETDDEADGDAHRSKKHGTNLWRVLEDSPENAMYISQDAAKTPAVTGGGRNPTTVNTTIAYAETELLRVFHTHGLCHLVKPSGMTFYQARLAVPENVTAEQSLLMLKDVCAATTEFIKTMNRGQATRPGKKQNTEGKPGGMNLNIQQALDMFPGRARMCDQYGEPCDSSSEDEFICRAPSHFTPPSSDNESLPHNEQEHEHEQEHEALPEHGWRP